LGFERRLLLAEIRCRASCRRC